MAETKIEWTATVVDGQVFPGFTFNPWRGCSKVSPGCDHCYAETLAARNPAVLGEWGPGARRVEAAESYWDLPRKWHRQAVQEGKRFKVFCASLADVFDKEAPVASRNRLWQVIASTSGYIDGFTRGGLDWLILTKRPGRIGDVLREDGVNVRFFQDNRCWVGVSVESQEYLKRFWAVRHWSPVPWISAEPLLGPLEMPEVLKECRWVVVGGESGPIARPCEEIWIRRLVNQCRDAAVPCFVKQFGSNVWTRTWLGWPKGTVIRIDGDEGPWRVHLRAFKGGNINEFPKDLRVREWPELEG